jgi:S-adenosylmethionine:tRNA ribosyltransferase-isomerase
MTDRSHHLPGIPERDRHPGGPESKGDVADSDTLNDPAAYDYFLPEGKIASRPATPRDAARLLVLTRGEAVPQDRVVRDLPQLLSPGDLVVVNETRVIPARLFGTIERGARAVEILLIREAAPGLWAAWVRPARALREGDAIRFEGQETVARFVGRRDETAEIAFEGEVSQLLTACGHVPLPPYIRRPDDAVDQEDYQTIYARVPGAVAAPTAGLHFTESLIARLTECGVGLARILLHVGPGTFRPIRVPDIRAHRVLEEFYEIPAGAASAIAEARSRGGRIVAVGTTTVRALESWARTVEQMDAPAQGWTDLTIVPPFEFRVVDVLLTNFHLPKSSLLLLVCAFGGRERILAGYEEAVRRGYRFYSYGDAMVVF